MGKKDKEEMARQREKFLGGCQRTGIDPETAGRIFDKIEKFASYGFNKSHAAAYAYLSYATAYFKANYPKEWMAALMTCDRDDTAKVAKFIGEAQSMHIAALPPDINQAGSEFAAARRRHPLCHVGDQRESGKALSIISSKRGKEEGLSKPLRVHPADR